MSETLKETAPKPFIFVLMPFEESFADIYKFGIKGAAEEVGAYAERIDEQIFDEGILDRIFNQISKADVIVADMTGRNPNVFYEVGYAHALNKIVLLLTRNADDIPFDLKHRQHIVYGGSIDTLKSELVGRLAWAITEARQRGLGMTPERFLLSIDGRDVPPAFSGAEPLVCQMPRQRRLKIQVRNGGTSPTSAVTHMYLFTSKNARLEPFGWAIVPDGMKTLPRLSLHASPEDADDGLTKQWNLGLNLPSIPPRATEMLHIGFGNVEKMPEERIIPFRLRLHSSIRHYDFSFSVKLEAADDE